MFNINDYKAIPVGSLLILDKVTGDQYLAKLNELPKGLANIVLSSTTGAFIKGLVRTNNLDEKLVPQISFAIFRVAVGEVTLAQLGSLLSSELKLANDKAQALATEIEKELFSSVSLELNQIVSKKKQQPKNSVTPPPNTINLKAPQPPKPFLPPKISSQ